MTTTPARRVLDLEVDEAHLLRDVVHLARQFGWLCYHTHRSDHSAAGFPDLCLVRAERVVFAELKRQKGRIRAAQAQWLAALEKVSHQAPGVVEVHLWRPSDLDSIVEVLR